MPLDPNISLQVKPVEMASPDIAKTLLGYAQIKNLTAEADLRNLQMAQMGLKMRDVAAFSAPGGLADQLQALRQPQPASGMVNGRDLGQLPPGQAAQGLPRPQSDQGAWVPPASPTQTSYASEDLTTTGPTLPFGRQAIPQGNVAYTATPGQARALQPGYAPPLATAPPGAPSQAAAPASAPRTLSPEQQAEQAFQLTQDWSLRHPNAPEMVKPIVELNQALLAHRKGALEIEEKGLNVVAQGTAAINRLPEAER